MNGKAVAMCTYTNTSLNGNQQPVDSMRLVVFTIAGTSVTQRDIVRRKTLVYFPTWSFDGRRIAFYERGNGLAIMDASGGNFRVVAKMPDWRMAGEDHGWATFISWPGDDNGKWIYYHRTCAASENCPANSSGEIWKVNADDTAQKALVCDYTKNNNTVGGVNASFERFSLSANAMYCVSMLTDFGPADVTGYQQGIVPHTFPPLVNSSTGWIDPWLTAPTCTDGFCGSGGCNSGLSASGAIIYYFDGSHDRLRANFWDHTAKTHSTYAIGSDIQGSLGIEDLDRWLSPRVGLTTSSTFVYPRGSSNSDMIVSILANWTDSAGYAWGGNNFFVVNWRHRVAVMATNFPNELAPTGWTKQVGGQLPAGIKYWYADAGDFWLADGPAGCYQALDGSWISLAPCACMPISSVNPSSVALVKAASTLHGTVAVYSLAGARVGMFDAASLSRGIPAQLSRGTYFISDRGMTGQVRVLHDGVLTR